MPSIIRKIEVDQDLEDLADYLWEQSPEVAERFLDSVVLSLKFIAHNPRIGSLKVFSDSSIKDVRTWWVKGFPNHLIYYRAIEDGVLILAVLHGSRDAQRFLARRA